MPFSEYSEKLLKKWTRKALIYKGFQRQGRNEGRPIQGIETINIQF